MHYVLLTWNPGPSNDATWTPAAYRDAIVVPLRAGQYVETSWSTGNHKHTIKQGDRAFLYRQGEHGRGIIAAGEILTPPETGTHWSDESKTSNYVQVRWFDAVEVGDRVDQDELIAAMPGFNWKVVPGSGKSLPEDVGQSLAALFVAHSGGTKAPPPKPKPGGQGQGFGTAEQNARIEQAAMLRVTEEWEAVGYEVRDVSRDCLGYDLEAWDGDVCEHVIEVKGTSGPQPRVLLTAGEYRRAVECPDWWVLAVVTCALDEDEQEYYEFTATAAVGASLPMTYVTTLDPSESGL